MLARDAGTLLLVRAAESEGAFEVTCWEPSEIQDARDVEGARFCTELTGGTWARVDHRAWHEFGIPRPWEIAWERSEQIVPELVEIGMRCRGTMFILGDAQGRLESARKRAERALARKRSGKAPLALDYMKDAGPLGLGGLRES